MEDATAVIVFHTSNLIKRGIEVLDEAGSETAIKNFFETIIQAKGLLEMLIGQPHFQLICEPFNSSIQFGLGVVLDCMQSKNLFLQLYQTPDLLMHEHTEVSDEFGQVSINDYTRNKNYFEPQVGTLQQQKENDESQNNYSSDPHHRSQDASSLPRDETNNTQQQEDLNSQQDRQQIFDDIIGQHEAKTSLFENIVLPLQLPCFLLKSLFVGVRQASLNVLLFGPPGTGKTTLAKAAASEAGATFYSVAPSHILSKYQGESERKLKELFIKAKETSPAIIFFDEIDCVGTYRGSTTDVQARRLLAELLLQMNEISAKDKVALIGATNRLEDMDPALLRRFYSRVFVGVPNHEDRQRLLHSLLKAVRHDLNGADIEELSIQTDGWSGSDIETLCREAAMAPLRACFRDFKLPSIEYLQNSLQQIRPVSMNDFGTAYEILMKPTLTHADNSDDLDHPHVLIG